MDYNLVGLRQRVRIDKLDDEEFDGGVIDNFINDTQRDIFNQYELPFQEKIFQGTIPAGSTMFQSPKDLAQLQYETMAGVQGFSGTKMTWREFFNTYPDNTNTTGTGFGWTFSLPVAVRNASLGFSGSAYALDNGVNNYSGIVNTSAGGTTFSIYTSAASGTSWRDAVPFQWGSTDYLNATITYEAA